MTYLEFGMFLNVVGSHTIQYELRFIRHSHNVVAGRVSKQPVHTNYHIYQHTHPFNGPLSVTTQVSWCQRGKTNLDFTEASAGLYATLHIAPDR